MDADRERETAANDLGLMADKTTARHDPKSPLWWGIDPNGRANEKKLKQIVNAAVAAAHPQEIILFGSGARGKMDQDSDLDLLVVSDSADPWKTARAIRAARPRHSPPLHVIVVSPETVEAGRNDPASPLHEVLREGRMLYTSRTSRTETTSDDRSGS